MKTKIKINCSTILMSVLFINIYAQKIDSTENIWRGSYYPNGTSPKDGKIIYLQLPNKSNDAKLKIYNQIYNSTDYALKKATIQYDKKDDKKFKINEIVIIKKSNNGKINWCRLQIELKYDSISGYLIGNYASKECKNYIGKIILYKHGGEFPKLNENGQTLEATSPLWWLRLDQDIQKGYNAPEVRKKERDNFIFQPIFFDFDKDEIKLEFQPFLDDLIHIIEQHSDLRIKVTGHTDWDGTDKYNDKLSERRAQAIIKYFVEKGIESDRLEFDFKGEKEPIDTNETPQGRQRNRRVDFQFI